MVEIVDGGVTLEYHEYFRIHPFPQYIELMRMGAPVQVVQPLPQQAMQPSMQAQPAMQPQV